MAAEAPALIFDGRSRILPRTAARPANRPLASGKLLSQQSTSNQEIHKRNRPDEDAVICQETGAVRQPLSPEEANWLLGDVPSRLVSMCIRFPARATCRGTALPTLYGRSRTDSSDKEQRRRSRSRFIGERRRDDPVFDGYRI
jgi:hypothetical protein